VDSELSQIVGEHNLPTQRREVQRWLRGGKPGWLHRVAGCTGRLVSQVVICKVYVGKRVQLVKGQAGAGGCVVAVGSFMASKCRRQAQPEAARLTG
jgi:hypothetical protein